MGSTPGESSKHLRSRPGVRFRNDSRGLDLPEFRLRSERGFCASVTMGSPLHSVSSHRSGGITVLFLRRTFMGLRSSRMANPVIIPATSRHTATVIFLHGLGDTGHGWSGELQRIRQPHIKYICPTAPSIPVALNMGMRMPAWFNLYSLDAEGPQDEAGIKTASETIQGLIKDEETAGISSERIMVGGFSMGGALALFCSLTYKSKLAGVIGLSTWLPLADQVPPSVSANGQVPIFMGHGDADDIVPKRWGQMTATALQKFNPNVQFSTYSGMGHSSCKEEMDAVENFIKERLPAQ